RCRAPDHDLALQVPARAPRPQARCALHPLSYHAVPFVLELLGQVPVHAVLLASPLTTMNNTVVMLTCQGESVVSAWCLMANSLGLDGSALTDVRSKLAMPMV